MRKKNEELDSAKLCDAIVEGMQENKAKDIVIMDLRGISNAVCDFFVICSGESSTQVDGISNSVTRHTRKTLKKNHGILKANQIVNGFYWITSMLLHTCFTKMLGHFTTSRTCGLMQNEQMYLI